MTGRKYPIVQDGEWIRPIKTDYRLRCCDCGLVHIVNFKYMPEINGKFKIVFRAFRDIRATAAIHAAKKRKRLKRKPTNPHP